MAILSDLDIFGPILNFDGIPQSEDFASKSAGYCLYTMLRDYNTTCTYKIGESPIKCLVFFVSQPVAFLIFYNVVLNIQEHSPSAKRLMWSYKTGSNVTVMS